jgi:hypothetical protein
MEDLGKETEGWSRAGVVTEAKCERGMSTVEFDTGGVGDQQGMA